MASIVAHARRRGDEPHLFTSFVRAKGTWTIWLLVTGMVMVIAGVVLHQMDVTMNLGGLSLALAINGVDVPAF